MLNIAKKVAAPDEQWRSRSGFFGIYQGVLLIVLSCLVTGVLVILIAVRGHETRAAIIDAFLAEIGIALVVAGVLAATVDIYMRFRSELEHARQQAEISESIFRHLFGFGLNQSIVDELTETIFASKLRRDELALDYEFWDAGEDAVGIRLTVNYVVVNSSKGKARYLVAHYFENTVSITGPDGFTSLRVDGAGHALHFEQPELAQLTKRAGIRRVLVGPEIDVPANQSVRVRYCYETVRRMSDSEVWITTLPASDLRLTVALLDEKVATLSFVPDASHRNEPELVSDAPETRSRLLHWRITNGLLPYQGVVLYWCPSDMLANQVARDKGALGGSLVIPMSVPRVD
jgi:hypothetical protein